MTAPRTGFVSALAFSIALLSCRPQPSSSAIDQAHQPIVAGHTQILHTIAFGSCSDEDESQPFWKYAIQNEADLWIWLGDIIYGDTEDPEVLKQKYDQQKSKPEYIELLKNTMVVGIWDDHDYGVNDGDKRYPIKKQSRDILFDFLDIPAPTNEGAYQSYVFGSGKQKVKIILLDTRYFKDPIQRNPTSVGQRYLPSENGDILGEAQWQWLASELTDSDAAIHVLCSGIQVIPIDHAYEKWSNYPVAQRRLYDLLVKTQASRTILLSGDRHLAEISRIELDSLAYPLYDITSSGMTHSYEEVDRIGEKNRYRVSSILTGQKNFGQLLIHWEDDVPHVTAEIRGLGNHIIHQLELDL